MKSIRKSSSQKSFKEAAFWAESFKGKERGICDVLKVSHLARLASGKFLRFIYLTFFHCWLLPTLGAVPCHNASPQALAVARSFLHGVGFGMIAVVVRGAAALRQAELLAQHSVLLLHLPHADLQALTLPLARRRVPRAVGLGFKRRQRHWLPICKARKQNTSVRIGSTLRFSFHASMARQGCASNTAWFCAELALKAALKWMENLDKCWSFVSYRSYKF